ncbi:MAG: low affinity potassium transporter [Chrysothrix sp. TS-e1954]|nr:MAG: low affinity potassium transporter [Chrysothrix sp. TS-e1954]
MFGPWIETWIWIKGLAPHFSSFKNHRISFNFIMLHYIYIISIALIGSVIIYGSKNMAYVDALFFGCGAATQSGLNTININDLHVYQQVTIMFIASITNPIWIHSFVVFIRLYWFEKRFQNVVLESRRLRRTRERSRAKDEPGNDHDNDPDLEVGGMPPKRMTVVHPGEKTIADAEKTEHEKMEHPMEQSSHSGYDGTESSSSNSNKAEDDKVEQDPGIKEFDGPDPKGPLQRNITFADEVKQPTRRQTTNSDRLPQPQSADTHIAFFEKQRNPKDNETLYIPGPRDFDRGQGPQQLDDDGISPSISHAETFPSIPEDGEDVANHSQSKKAEHSSRDPRNSRRTGTVLSDSVVVFARAKRSLSSVIRSRMPLQKIDENEQSEGQSSSKSPAHEHKDDSLRHRGRSRTFGSFMTQHSHDFDPMPYLSYQPTMGRNSAFVNLSETQREELGGIEYRALKLLTTVLVVYYFGFHLLGLFCYLPWILHSGNRKGNLRSDGINPAWWGVFTPASMFNDLGMTLTPDSMDSFSNAVFILLLGSFLIIVGNTGFPCMLRFVIWSCSQLVPVGSAVWEELRFLLDHPRRCFTLLFPGNATWWLFWVLVLLNVIDVVFFIILDLHDTAVEVISGGLRVLDGIFQAASTRTAGFSVVSLSALHPAIQVSYLIMMYISVFPIAISIRKTNVYEEKSLGVYTAPEEVDDQGRTQSYLGHHLRRQLSFDLWYVFLGLFIIAIVEGARLQASDQYAFTLFSVLFEVVSAYGTVGLSLGYPGTDPSFSAQFHTISKLIIIAMQLRGRHRGLPYALDKAVLLPSEHLQRKEADVLAAQERRRHSGVATLDGHAGHEGDDGDDDGEARDRLAPLSSKNRTYTNRSEGGKSSKTSASARSAGGGLVRLISKGLATGPQPRKRSE